MTVSPMISVVAIIALELPVWLSVKVPLIPEELIFSELSPGPL